MIDARHARTARALRPLLFVSLLLACGTLVGCSTPRRDLSRAQTYPIAIERGEVLDVQVIREGTIIRATNTTTQALGPGVLWINMRFGKLIDAWQPGQTLTLGLAEFRDSAGEAFRAGGFFSRDEPDDVVLVQLQSPAPAGERMLGLVTVEGKGER